ncbi:MAG: HNH endonuclease [Dehalococcoidia bacterium]
MARRWAAKTRLLLIQLLVGRDGPGCQICHSGDTPLEDPIEIDHIDPDGPDEGANLRLLCKPCNLDRRRSPSNRLRDRGIIERERETSPTDQAKSAIPYAEGPAEMRASTWFETSYRAWVINNSPMPKAEAINGGAEATGCSTETSARYLAKLTSLAGPLTQDQDIHGVMTIKKKEPRP